jgi:hypothetical protein
MEWIADDHDGARPTRMRSSFSCVIRTIGRYFDTAVASCSGPLNRSSSLVYRCSMRLLTILCFLLPIAVAAQPEPPSFCFVLAEDVKAMRPLQGSVTVVHYYLDPVPYHGTPGRDLSKNEVQALQGGPLFRDSSEQWVKYMPVPALGRAHLLVIQGTDTMRIDLSDGPLALIERAWLRADRDTPEVIRFRKGSYAIEQLVDEPWALAATNTMAERLLAEDEATYRKQTAELEEYYRNLPPTEPPVPPPAPPAPMTPEEQIAAFWADRPPLSSARIDRVNADTIWVEFTGRVMLNGDCSSSMPMFGLEMRSDTGWVERIPFDYGQMDCGLPWADWEGHEFVMPLQWWAERRSREHELAPGRYRLLFMGGNREMVRTASFSLK